MSDREAEAREMARDGYGWHDICVRLDFCEYDARCFVFGKGAAMAWLKRRTERANGRGKNRAREDVPA